MPREPQRSAQRGSSPSRSSAAVGANLAVLALDIASDRRNDRHVHNQDSGSHQALRIGPGVDDLSFEVRPGLTNAPGPGPAHSLPAAVADLVLAGYAVVMLLAASRTTIRRDVA